MRVHEHLFLNPFEKMVRHGTPPVKFILQLALVALMTTQVSLSLQEDIVHCFHATQHLSTLLLGSSEGRDEYMLPEELREAVESALKNSFAIQENTFNDMLTFIDEDSPHLEVHYMPVRVMFRNRSMKEVNISRKTLLAASNPGDYLQLVLPVLYGEEIRFLAALSLSFGIYEVVLLPQGMPRQHYIWHLNISFDGLHVGTFKSHLDYTLHIPPFHKGDSLHPRRYLHVVVLAIALLSTALVLKRVVYSCHVLFAIKRKAIKQLSSQEAVALFNWWWLVSLTSHGVQVYVAIYCLSTTSPDALLRFSLLGWSCALSWINICQYFEHFPGFYVGFKTTGIGIVSVAKYTLSVFPILTAFTILGTCLFWKAEFFKSFTASYASLFALLNGDIVHDVFDSLWDVAGMQGHVFLYVFIFIFIYIVLKVNIMIIEEAYLAARSQGSKYDRMHEEAAGHLVRQVSPPGSPASAATACLAAGPSARRLLKSTLSPSRLWRMSPRFWDSDGLREALSQTFDKVEDEDGSSPRLPPRDVSAQSGVLIDDKGRRHSTNAAWWLDTLPQMTQLLRSRPLPEGDEMTLDLQAAIKEFVAAVAQVADASDKDQPVRESSNETACRLS